MSSEPPSRTYLQEQARQLMTQPAQVDHFLDLVRHYLRTQVRAAKGMLTPELIGEIRWLYALDVPRTPVVIAEVLGVSQGKLPWLLARERIVACEHCGGTFTIRERWLRSGKFCAADGKTHGKGKNYICKKCSREIRKEHETKWAAEWEKQATEKRRQAQVDAQILVARDPLTIAPLRRDLERFATSWVEEFDFSDPFASWDTVRVQGGCMICGRRPVHLLTAQQGVIAEDGPFMTLARSLHIAGSFSHDREIASWAPLTHPLQALWRMSPQVYFVTLAILPVLERPLILLCDRCLGIELATHKELETGRLYP